MKGMSWESPRGPISIDPETRDIVQNIYIRKVEKKNGNSTTSNSRPSRTSRIRQGRDPEESASTLRRHASSQGEGAPRPKFVA